MQTISIKNMVIFTLIILNLLYVTNVFASTDFYMGIFPRRSVADTSRLFTPIADYLTEKLGKRVILQTAPSYKIFLERLKLRQYDLVHFNQYHYIQAKEMYGYDIILKNEEFGKSTISGIIVTKKGYGINKLEDLNGKKIIFGGGKSAMMAYIAPTYLLNNAGLMKNHYIEKFASNPMNAIVAVHRGLADAAGIGDVLPQIAAQKGLIDADKIIILAKSEKLPHLVWAVKKEIRIDIGEKIKNILVKLKVTIAGQALLDKAQLTRFVPALDTDYDITREMVKQVFEQDLK